MIDLPQQQNAVVQLRFGAPHEVLETRTNFAVTPPGADQVLIKVEAASVNPIDWQMILGNRKLITGRSFPFVPLFDIAGAVIAVGGKVTRFKPGDRVYCDNQLDGGGAAEYVNVDASLVGLMPSSLTFEQAAAVPLAAQTALACIDNAGVGKGGTVCVIGASGGVGSYVVQIAKALGSRVIAVCSGPNAEFVKALGADEVIDYRQQRLEDGLGGRKVDAIIDCVGGRQQWLSAKRVLRSSGNFVTIARDEDGMLDFGAIMRLVPPILFRKLMGHFGEKHQYKVLFLDANADLLDRISALIDAQKVQVPLSATYPLTKEGVVAAFEASMSGRTVGKIVLSSAGTQASADLPSLN